MPALTRRDILCRAANGFGALALQSLLVRDGLAAPRINPLAAKQPDFPTKAKSVIFLFMVGGPSQIDTFDPKPKLEKLAGQQLPASYGKVVSQFTDGSTPILPSPWKFKQHGQSGAWVSTLFPNIAECVDDICFVRNFYTESTVHAPAMYQVMSGRILMGHPSVGSWVTYGLGSESDNLPGYVVMPQPEGTPEGGTPMWGSAYLPAVYQATLLRPGPKPIVHLHPGDISMDRQRARLDLLQRMNELDTPAGDSELAARISSYELAFRMQSHAPEAVDLKQESEATKRLYGLDQKQTAEFGTRCLLARRFVERGVRFVQIYHGGGPISMQWDAHDHLQDNHEKMCGHSDRPVAALLKDLKSRGLLDSTLVVWGSEFGRLPMSQSGNGRDHNPHGFTMWFAGGGIKAGQTLGETDELGLNAVDGWHMRDFHATILHALGIDQHKLWYLHNGRHEKLTDFGGKVIQRVFSYVLALFLAAATLTDQMWTEAKPIYDATLRHPYLKGLADGSLPKASFLFYLEEDAKYLRAFSEALEVLAKKAPRPEWAATLRKHATEAIEAELQLHKSYGVGKEDAPPVPTNYAYMNHLRQPASFAEGLAAMLPCYWIYWEVGKELVKRGSKDKDYQRWIDQYASEGYGATVRQVLDMMNAEAARLTPAQRRRAIDVFVLSARYEYMFWDMAWRREQWPPSPDLRH